ncbi:probable JmjC domain-containing histone demethylation protein 2C isoform X1 [Amblyraja radiata]|uniref:probable JmjC domain-containing histone demethylation protein 2C isoform X1 n=1 Tax=Amblyraja radiata TaxID=386614 RepID=UPI00140296FE|nr:probable JmjC domain-containing histone demethylation protein 2C isoform X1 [Amblyraja radiata]
MIVVNDKIPDARNVEPTLIQGSVLGDEGPSPCDGCGTYRPTSHRVNQADSHRPFASPPVSYHSSFPRQTAEQCNANNNGRGSPSDYSANHSREGNQHSEGAEMKNHKRKLSPGEDNDVNLPKQPRTTHNASARLGNGHTRSPQGTERQGRKEAAMSGHKEGKGMEEMGRGAQDGSCQSKPSPHEDQFGRNLDNPAKHYHNGKGESKSSPSSYEKGLVQASPSSDGKATHHKIPTPFRDHLEDLGRSPLLFPVHSVTKSSSGSWRDASRLYPGKEGQKVDIQKGPLPSSVDYQGSQGAKFKSKEWSGRSDSNDLPAHKEGHAVDALCPDNSQKFCFQHPSPKANNADASKKTLVLNKRAPSPLYNGSGVLEAAWHPFYSAPTSGEISGPQLVSYVTKGAGSSTYSHLHAHFPHFLSGSLPIGHQSSLSSLLALNPQLDMAYSTSLGPLASAYSCYHPKHLQASNHAQLSAAYGHLNFHPAMWQNVNIDMHSGSRLVAAPQGYVNGEPTYNMGYPNPWSFHQSHKNVANDQAELGQYSSITNAKELAGAKANSTYVYNVDINGARMYGDFLHPFPHCLGKVEVQNVSCSKVGLHPVPEGQLYKEVAFKQDLESDGPAEAHNGRRDDASITAEVRDGKPLSLVLNEPKTKPGEPPLVPPNLRPASRSKESPTPSSSDFTLMAHSPPDFPRKMVPTTQHQQVIVDENHRGLTLEATSVNGGISLQHSPFHRPPRDAGAKVKDHYHIQYQAPRPSLLVNSLENKNTLRDLSHGHFEQRNDAPKVSASPLPLVTSTEARHPSQLPLTMPVSKSPDAAKIQTLIPRDIASKDFTGNPKHGKPEPDKANHVPGIHSKVPVHYQIPSTPCLPACGKQMIAAPPGELGGRMRQATYSTTACTDNRHQERDGNPYNKEHCSNSPNFPPSGQGLAQYGYNLSPLKGAVNGKSVLQETGTTADVYTPKKYKAARTATPCAMKPASDWQTLVRDTQASSVSRDTTSPKVPLANCSPLKPASVPDAVNASPSLQSSPPGQHTKLKKAWLTRHSEQDTSRERQESRVGGAAPGPAVSRGQGAATAAGPEQPDGSQGGPAAKRSSEGERGNPAESRHWLRARREAKLANQCKAAQDSGEDAEKNNSSSSKAREEEELKAANKNEKENTSRRNGRLEAPGHKEQPKPTLPKSLGESFLQDVPCTELFTNIPRCRDCWPSRSRKGPESPPFSCSCRFMHLRRLSVGRNGGLKVEGFSTEEQINEEMPLESPTGATDTGLDRDTSAYILGHVGDLFCGLVLSEQGLLERIGKSYDGAIACKAANGEKEERCDCCHSVVFNLHWVCLWCGFFVCMECYSMKQKKCTRNDKERGEDFTTWLKCAKGHNHDVKSLQPTQLVPNTALVSLCEKMHRGKKRLGIKSNCTCVDGDKNWALKAAVAAVVNKSVKLQTEAKVEGANSVTSGEKPVATRSTSEHSQGSNINHSCSQSPLHWLAELATRKAKQEANEAEDVQCHRPRSTSSRSPVDQESRTSEHGSTLCDLLTTTAGKLRMGSTDAGIAFAPVYTTLNSCSMASRSMPSILDDIIASVVEKKIPITKPQRQRSERESNPFPMQSEELNSTLHYSWLAKGCFPWIQDPADKNNWRFFREYWAKGLPVLVSGVLMATDSNSWGPECLRQDLGEQSVSLVNCRDQSVLTRARSKEFWEGFKTNNSNCHRLKGRSSKILRLDYCASEKEFSQQMPAQFEELHKHLPLPEYTRNDGKLNLVSRFPEETAKSQLELRVCSVYGLSLDDGNKGSTSLHLELTDTLHILVHVEPPKEDRKTLEKAVLASLKGESADDAVMRRLNDPSQRPGALWHIYSSQDTEKIKEFLHKVLKEGDCDSQDQQLAQSCYLDQKLRTRLLEESGIRGKAVLQFRGDAVLIPTATSYQVQYFSSCISVTKQFVSPEHIKHSFTTWPLTRESRPLVQHTHKLQMKSILYNTVKDCVETLAATSLG